jgi:transglutaminase superfamily protein
METVRQFRRISSTERCLTLNALVLLFIIGLGLRLISPARLCRALAICASSRRPSITVAPDRIAWSVDRASRCLPGMRCLPRAMATYRLLQRHGHPARVYVGVGLDRDSRYFAHAWTETHDGEVVDLAGRRPSAMLMVIDLMHANAGRPWIASGASRRPNVASELGNALDPVAR